MSVFSSGDGRIAAAKACGAIITKANESRMDELEALCTVALETNGGEKALARHATAVANKKPLPKKGMDLGASLSSGPSASQIINHSIRFSLEGGKEGRNRSRTQSSNWPFGSSSLLGSVFGSSSSSSEESRDYEEVVLPEILNAPICDIIVVQRGEATPKGYYRIARTPNNKKANLNAGAAGNQIYLCVKKDLSGDQPHVTAIIAIFPGRGEFCPPGFGVVKRDNEPCNLNAGTSSERIYLCLKRDKTGNPLIDVQIILPGKDDLCPKNFSLIEKSPTGVLANLNAGTGGGRIFLCYRQQLRRLLCLTVAEIPPSTPPSLHRPGGGGKQRSSLLPSNSSSPSLASAGGGGVGGGALEQVVSGNTTPLRARTETEESSFEAEGEDDGVPLRGGAAGKGGSSSDMEEHAVVEEEIDEADIHGFLGDEQNVEVDRQHQPVVDVDGHIAPEPLRKSLHALLAGLYCRHANREIAMLVLTNLTSLLKDTDFFEHDLSCLQIPGTITMLDVTVEAVCDRFDACLEEESQSILTFLQALIKHSSGRLSFHSLQRIFKALSFMCNCYAKRTKWFTDGLPMPCIDKTGELNAFKVLRDVIWAVVAQVETVECAHMLPDDGNGFPPLAPAFAANESYILAHSIVIDFVEEVIDSVEVSCSSEAAHLLISKQSSSVTSNAFWQQINVVSKRLFSDYVTRCAFVSLCALSKLAWVGIRITDAGSPSPGDLGSKLLALEGLLEFCQSAGEHMRNSKIMGYQIRRLVVPCLLNNIQHALVDHRIFSKLLKIISALWKIWRVHVRIEFAILVEQLIIRVMQADQLQIKPVFQIIVIQEVVTWFDQPHLLVEMFVNYDMDRKFVSHWNIFSHLVRAVCTTAKRVSDMRYVADGGGSSSSSISGGVGGGGGSGVELAGGEGEDGSLRQPAVTARQVHMQALEEVGRIAKTLMDTTGHAYLMMQDANFRSRSLGTGAGWEEDFKYDDESPLAQPSPKGSGSDLAGSLASSEDAASTGPSPSPTTQRVQGVRFRRAVHQEAEELLKQAISIYQEKDSLLKAVRFLISKSFMADTPQEIASFLRVYKTSFDPSAIGDFLGEGGRTPSEQEYWDQIRFRYTRAVSFVEMDLEPALRLYLTGCGFRLPGEAQKINRFVEVFVKTFWQDNSGTAHCPFVHPDAVHLCVYAVIMLNTDHHRANVDKKKGHQKMSKEEFIRNLRGADQDKDIDRDYLMRIYDNIEKNAINLAVEASEAGLASSTSASSSSSSTFSASTGPGGASRNLHHRASLLSNVGLRKPSSENVGAVEEKAFVRNISRSLRDSEDLLRSLSPFTYRFQVTGVDTNISLDLVSYMYETVWFHFEAIARALLSRKSSDMYATFHALDILCCSLSSCIFLGLSIERKKFADLLRVFSINCGAELDGRSVAAAAAARLSLKASGGGGGGGGGGDLAGGGGGGNDWYTDVQNVTPESAMEVIATVHKLIVRLKDAIQELESREQTRAVAARIDKMAQVLENNSFFVCEGDLAKRNRNGRLATYRFFLFSDNLIYAHPLTLSGGFKVHEQLDLENMTVSDLDTDTSYCSLYIRHPTKSFVVVASTPSEKQQWLRDISNTIGSCKKRKDAAGRARKMSFFSRIESQQQQQIKEKEITIRNTQSPDRNSARGLAPVTASTAAEAGLPSALSLPEEREARRSFVSASNVTQIDSPFQGGKEA